MKEIYPEILEVLDTRRLVEIMKIGKYNNPRGFRIDSKNTLQKRNAMIRELLNSKKLNMALKKYAETLVENKKIDNIWTFPDTITVDDVVEQIKKDGAEITYLELISNNKEDLIKDVLYQNENEELLNSGNEEDTASSATLDIQKLRTIIQKLESENRKLEKSKMETSKENNRLNLRVKSLEDINDRQKQRESIINNKYEEVHAKIEAYEVETNELKEILSYYKKQNGKLELKIESLNKIKVLIIGGEKTKDWFKYTNQKNIFEFIFEESTLSNLDKTLTIIDEIWVINNLLPNSKINQIEEEERFIKLKSINRTRYFWDFNEIEKCMDQLEELYCEE